MLQKLRTRFGIPGVISVIALVFAMFGGAYAASGLGGGDNATASGKAPDATASATAKRGPQGPRGPKGAKGPAGPAGPAGSAGPAGPAGAKGDTGAPGAAGAAGGTGTSPEGTPFTGSKTVGSVTCTEGGTEYKGATTNIVCNGRRGTNGIEGPPGPTCDEVTGECLLPEGATETGLWAASGGKETFQVYAAISFPLRPSSEPAETHYVTLAEQGGTPAPPPECPGTFEHPEAIAESEPALCLYEQTRTNLGPPITGFTPNRSIGVTMRSTVTDQSLKTAATAGTWALTAPVTP